MTRLLADRESAGVASRNLASRDYEVISTDSRDLKLFEWRAEEEPSFTFHVYPNGIAICELHLELEDKGSVDQLERAAQTETEAKIKQWFPAFIELLHTIVKDSNNDVLVMGDPSSAKPVIRWISRALVFSRPELGNDGNEHLIREWLAGTRHPEDAEEIFAGRRDYSMTWLNYVMIDLAKDKEDDRLGAMILCQYLYTAQEECNRQLKQAIEIAYSSNKRLKHAKATLENSRITAQLHHIAYNEFTNYLTRNKRRYLSEILEGWEFDRLVKNGQHMVNVCSNRLDECQNRQYERSSVLTDLLLVTLSFFTVFELSIYLTEFSREMMSRPALDYHDEHISYFLSAIANIDADVMFASGFGLTLILVIVYRFLKLR